MHRMLLGFAMVVAVLVLPQIVKAEGPERAGPPSPEMLFKHLDANHDGVITEDEIPAYAPEPLKALLKAADKKGDKKVTLEEFTAAFKEHPLPPPHFGAPPFGGSPFGGPPFGGPHGMAPPPFAFGGPGFAPQGPPGPPHGGPLGKAPDFKQLFQKFDKDKDGKLTLEEFTEGMKQLHRDRMEHVGPQGPMPGCPMPPPPPPFGMMPQSGPGWWMMGGPMPGWHHGPSPCLAGAEGPAMGPHMGPPPHGPERDGKALEARLAELEAKVKALEAKAK